MKREMEVVMRVGRRVGVRSHFTDLVAGGTGVH